MTSLYRMGRSCIIFVLSMRTRIVKSAAVGVGIDDPRINVGLRNEAIARFRRRYEDG